MSETTRKLRKFGEGCEGHKLIDWYHMYLGMELAADVIEAVEAQVAEAAKRHEDLAAWCAETEARVAALEKMGRLGATPNGDDRTRGGMPPRGFDSPTPAAPTPPAPSAVPAPRGFRVGDRVRITKARDCSRDWIGCEGRIVAECNDSLLGDWRIGDLSKFKHIRTVPMFGENLTLVRAADAPEAPAEEDTGLVVQRIRDEATKPLHVEIEKLRAKLAAAEQALDVERRTSIDHDGKTFVHPTREARLTSTAESWSPWMRYHKQVEKERDALRAELDTLTAKPRFRTRKVTAKDVGAWEEEWCKDSYGAGERHKAMNALGFRRRVDGAK